MKNLLGKVLIFSLFIVVTGCSKLDDKLTKDTNEEELVQLNNNGEKVNFEDGGSSGGNFNNGNPQGFIIHATGNVNNFPIPDLVILIYDVTSKDFIVGAEFKGTEELNMEFILYNKETDLEPSEYIAQSKDDAYLKITEVDHENKTISGIFSFTGFLDWYEGGETRSFDGAFTNIYYK
ncbi:hypothetical protein JQC67_00025 [Aurantibacter crassamenti]|uniref:hypothetical protein n=1 Tax=Aurantibacter crassamenti TaxID=1837375 RepID=UPI00193A35D4|nr:hypothetical protein [Aurantibacter crassamenti]MBM1104510.1 hypothetical protein [Aurantibacter crassamenti]